MKHRPKVTMGLCVKNSEQTITETMESIVNQNFPHELMEIIVVDGCSKDKTMTIIRKILAKKNVNNKIFRENEGLGWARQIVVDNANGDFIVWVDSDVRLSTDYLRKQVEFMERNAAVGIAKGKCGKSLSEKMVATLENLGYEAIDFKYYGKPVTRLLETAGSIYRVKAIRQVGGFDKNIRGAGEDTDAAYRIRAAGWLLYITPAEFYADREKTWKALWDKYFWYGYGIHYVLHKNRNALSLYRLTPPAGFMAGLLLSLEAYKLTRQKKVLFLPIHFIFKTTALWFGFIKSHINSYGHMQ